LQISNTQKDKPSIKIVILDADTLGDDIDLRCISLLGELKVYGYTASDDVIARCLNFDVVITNKVVLNEFILKNLPTLKLICVAATGMNNIDLKAAKNLGITVMNVANYSTFSVAQHNFAMLLSLLNQIHHFNEFVKKGHYARSRIFTCHKWKFNELKGKRYGIIGMGNIGRQVAQIADSFGAEVVYYSTTNKNRVKLYKRVSLNDLLETSHIIGVHCPLNENTNNLIDNEEFQKMKKKPIIMNLARGGIVNEYALVDALNKGLIRGFCVDVYSKEPFDSSHPFYSILDNPNVILTPHVAWASQESRQKLVNLIAENIIQWIAQN